MSIEYEDVIDVHGKQYVRLMEVADKTIKMPTVRPLSSTDDCDLCEDCISRQAAIRACFGMVRGTGIDELPYEYAEAVLNDLPSVYPKQRTGRWKPYDRSWYECSECGAIREAVGYFENFCPNCGAKMEEVEE